jgi:hypothetical protein
MMVDVMIRRTALAAAFALTLPACARGCARKEPEVATDAAAEAADASASARAPGSSEVSFPRGRIDGTPAASSGPLAWATWAGRRVLLLADDDDEAVVTVDATTLETVSRTSTRGAPSSLRVVGGALYVALRDGAKVIELAPHASEVGVFEPARSFPTRAEPVALAGSESELVVLSALGRSLERFSLSDPSRPPAVTALGREPRSLLVLTSGDVVVGHASNGPLSIVKPSGEVDGVDLTEPHVCTVATFDECMTIDDLPATQHYALGELDGRVVALGSLSMTTGGSGVSYGPGNRKSTPVQLSIDVITLPQKHVAGVVGRRRPGACTLPRAMVVDRVRSEVVVACMGEDHLSRYALAKVAKEWSATDLRERVLLPGAPAALALDETNGDVVAWAREARTLTRLSRDQGRLVANTPHAVEAKVEIDPRWKKGRALFHAAVGRISTVGFACAHCHPDGRDDDVVWGTPRGPRRPMALVGLPSAGPFGWEGATATLDKHVDDTIRLHLTGTGLDTEESEALLSYVRSLQQPKRTPDDAGSAAFTKARCSVCHDPARGYGDGVVHEVGKGAKMRTPRLVGLGGRRSYFHDGRYHSLDAMLDDRALTMGDPSVLSPEERKALVGFLEGL